MACLNLSDSFLAFNKEKLIRLAQFYPSDFSPLDLIAFGNQLDTYIFDMRFDNHFLQLKGVGGIAKKTVQKKKNISRGRNHVAHAWNLENWKLEE
ncbi:hypothetical protein L1049_017336 [Liquidambar formosana]|uniref:Uncharacterized protein n=1 Tax=Liquidambar formosana TaxID=63359 RepID=A0AAP0S110_LIQFO